MTTRIDVFNDALGLKQNGPLVDADDNTEAGRLLREAWPKALRACFEVAAWNFAQKRAQLAALPDPPAHGYMVYYQLPANCLRIVAVSRYPNTEEDRNWDYSVEAGRIATNAPACWLRYVSGEYLTRLGDWPQVFSDYVAAELATRIQKLNTSSDNVAHVREEVKRRKVLAEAFDAQQNPPGHWQAGSWTRGRMGSGRSGGWARSGRPW
jgi:hypothetical protein